MTSSQIEKEILAEFGQFCALKGIDFQNGGGSISIPEWWLNKMNEVLARQRHDYLSNGEGIKNAYDKGRKDERESFLTMLPPERSEKGTTQWNDAVEFIYFSGWNDYRRAVLELNKK